jgi:RNA 2',3'-cyclic 3'-phosphodiesterase
LDLDDELRRRLGALQPTLASSFSLLRWARPEGMHLTLRFLGDATPDEIDHMATLLKPVAAATEAIEATVAGLGLFPDRGRPRVLWLAISADEPLLRLQASCEAAAVAAGFPREPRPFRAHLTLGRWRDRVPRSSLPVVGLGPTRFATLTLFKSDLRAGGSVYSTLARWRLGEKESPVSREAKR